MQPPQRRLEGFINGRCLPDDSRKLENTASASDVAKNIMKRTRCTSVRTTACERGVLPFSGMTISGFDRARSSRNWRLSCVPSTARYVSSHSSCCGAMGGVRGKFGCAGTGGGAAGWEACGAAILGPNHWPCIGGFGCGWVCCCCCCCCC